MQSWIFQVARSGAGGAVESVLLAEVKLLAPARPRAFPVVPDEPVTTPRGLVGFLKSVVSSNVSALVSSPPLQYASRHFERVNPCQQ